MRIVIRMPQSRGRDRANLRIAADAAAGAFSDLQDSWVISEELYLPEPSVAVWIGTERDSQAEEGIMERILDAMEEVSDG